MNIEAYADLRCVDCGAIFPPGVGEHDATCNPAGEYEQFEAAGCHYLIDGREVDEGTWRAAIVIVQQESS